MQKYAQKLGIAPLIQMQVLSHKGDDLTDVGKLVLSLVLNNATNLKDITGYLWMYFINILKLVFKQLKINIMLEIEPKMNMTEFENEKKKIGG